MDNKNLGKLLLFIGGVLLVMLMFVIVPIESALSNACPTNKYKGLVFTHVLIGIIFAIISLGVYLIFFDKGSQAIVHRLEQDKNKQLQDTQFTILISGLDDHEKKVMKAIREQDGIEQHTLRLRTDMSHTKLSLVLKELERRELITKEKKGKTNRIYLKNGYAALAKEKQN